MSKLVKPDISVVMSVYNGEKYIVRSLISLLVQTYTNFELIVIDDGSTDRTSDIIEKIKDDRIIFIRQQNLGLTKTLNKALEFAKGKWIARHDADDFSIFNRLELQFHYLSAHPEIGLLGSSCFIQPAKHGIINEIYDYPEHHQEIMSAFPIYNPFVHGAMMIRHDLLKDNGGYNESYRYVQDYELWSRLLPKTKAYNLTTPLYTRSVHNETSQLQIDKEPFFSEIRASYLVKYGPPTNPAGLSRSIRSISLYPAISLKNGWNWSLAATFYLMSQGFRKHHMPWLGMRMQSLLYYPWHLKI